MPAVKTRLLQTPERPGGGGTNTGQPASERDACGALIDAGTGTGTTDPDFTPIGFPRCGKLEPERANDCEGIDRFELFGPNVSAFTDGSIETGLMTSASVWVRNNDSVFHYDVCVGVVVDPPAIFLSTDEGETNPTWIQQANAGDAFIVSPAYYHVGSVAPGTVARFTFWSAFRGTNCTGPTVSVDAPVRIRRF